MPAENRPPDDPLSDTAALLASLGLVVDDMPTAVAVFDPDLRLRYCNRTWRRISEHDDGRKPARVQQGMHLTECVPGVEEWLEPFGRELMEGRTIVRHALPLTADGRTTYWDVTIAPTMQDGQITGFVQAVVDATERVHVQRELEDRVEERTAELERRRQVADGLHEVLAILNSCCPTEQVLDYIVGQSKRLLSGDANGVYRLVKSADGIVPITSHGIMGDLMLDVEYPADGFVARTVMQRKPLVAPDTSKLFGPNTDAMLPEHQERLRQIFTHYRAMLAVPIVKADAAWGALVMYYEQPREFSAEEIALASDLADHLALALENAELRESAETAAALDERARLARDLHDAVTQTLFSASLIAEVLPRLWERDPAEGERRLEQLQHLTRGALAEMRTLLLELRPTALEEADLGELLRQLAEAKGTSGLDVEVVAEGEPRRLDVDTHVALYRTAQEALNNITKHAGATRAEIALRYLPCSVELSVDDNGAGFDPSAVGGEHMGLRIMRERAEAVGGFFSVESTPGLGTCINVVVDDGGKDECGCRTA